MRQLVEETLKALGYFSNDSANLVLGTIAQESNYGKYRRQLGDGPALGIAQMEPNTFNDIVFNFLHYKVGLANLVLKICGLTSFQAGDLETNDKLAICMCRIQYLRFPEKIPNTVEGYADLWKLRYNTLLGKGKKEDFILNYKRFVLHDLVAGH